METKFNFNSQICTSIEQSRRLLELGLKQETADMTHHYLYSVIRYELRDIEFSRIMHLQELVNKKPVLGVSGDELYAKDIPAWSLHRLIEVIGDMFEMQHWLGFNIEKDYDHTIDCIEWLIEDNRFNKEYLEE